MRVRIYREESYDYCLDVIDKDSHPSDRERAVEIPDDLVARYRKAWGELGEVQELLQKLSGD